MTADKILATTITKVEALRRLRILKEFLNFRIYDSPPNAEFMALLKTFEKGFLDKSLREENPVLEAEKERDFVFIESLGEDFFNQFNHTNLNLLLKELEDSIDQTKTITLYLAFEITVQGIAAIGAWVKENLGANTLIEIKYDPNLIAGCAISINGLYKDYSVRQKISDNKKQVLETLSSYKNQTTS